MAQFRVTKKPYRSVSRPKLRWVVNVWVPGRPRARTFHEEETAANAAITQAETEVHNFGIRALELTAGQRIEALDAFEKISPFKVTLADVVNEFVERRKSSTLSVVEVVELFLKSRRQKGRSERHLASLENVLGRFTKIHGTVRIGDLTADQIQEWIYSQDVGPRTNNHHRAMLHTVFEYALKRKIVRENPTKQIELQTVKPGKVGILIPLQMRRLLDAAKDESDVLATIAIGGFAGLRPEEVARLRWDAFNFDTGVIDCGSEITKTASHRYVKIEPVLKAWVEDIWRSKILNTTHVQEENFRRRYDEVRRKAGFRAGKYILKPNESGHETATPEEIAAYDKTLIPWPHDAFRHSFASYHFAQFKDAGRTAFELGHKDTTMLFKNYRSRVSDQDAALWWSLLPEVTS